MIVSLPERPYPFPQQLLIKNHHNLLLNPFPSHFFLFWWTQLSFTEFSILALKNET